MKLGIPDYLQMTPPEFENIAATIGSDALGRRRSKRSKGVIVHAASAINGTMA
jgi:hypothetical protein